MGGVLGHELFQGPSPRQDSRVPEHEFVFVDADLDRPPRSVVLVGDGVDHCLAQGLVGNGPGLDPLDAFIADVDLEVFGEQEVEAPIDLCEQIAVDLIVVDQIGIRPEEADLHEGSGDQSFGILTEEEHGRTLEVAIFDQAKLVDQCRIRFANQIITQAPALGGLLAKGLERRPRQVLEREVRSRHGIPMPALPSA